INKRWGYTLAILCYTHSMEDPITESIADEYLKEVTPPWRWFWFHIHLVAKDLEGFGEGLAQISDDVFRYHVSGQKNDISKWVHDVIGDTVLSRQLRDIKTKEEAESMVRDRVSKLKTLMS